jgi:hypothetical protein
MHAFLRSIHGKDGKATGYAFWCPGCASLDPRYGLHVFTVKDQDGDSEQEWSFDGEASFEPSLAYESDPYCHLHLTDGMIRYYSDCKHAMAGQVVPLGPIQAGAKKERGH